MRLRKRDIENLEQMVIDGGTCQGDCDACIFGSLRTNYCRDAVASLISITAKYKVRLAKCREILNDHHFYATLEQTLTDENQ